MANVNSEKQAFEVMAAHIAALNARDNAAIAATLHFPHYRLAGHKLTVWESPDTYFADFLARAQPNWHHSEWDDLSIIASDEFKVHLDVTFSRFDVQGERLGRYRSMWVIVLIDGIWAAQLRSTFAP